MIFLLFQARADGISPVLDFPNPFETFS